MSNPSEKTEEDIKKISNAMDILANLLLQKRQSDTQAKIEYQNKLNELNKLINMILALNQKNNDSYEINETELDRLLRNGLEIIEKGEDKQKYALIPIIESNKDKNIPESLKKKKKKKKNKINCSYCNEIGHTRANCPKKLLNSQV